MDDTANKNNAVWASMCSDFSRKSMICAWSKVPTRSGGNCMDQDLTWNWCTLLRDSANNPTCTEIPPSKILLVSNNHPPHININRLVWNPKHWQALVNYRFWSGWVVPRRQMRPRWGKTGGSTARRPPRMFFILYDRAAVCTRQLQITNMRTNKAVGVDYSHQWAGQCAHSLSIALTSCPIS